LAVMLQATKQSEWGAMSEHYLEQFPCKDLRTIDQLWVSSTNGHFGFSVQKKIWEKCGRPEGLGKEWDRFCIKVGWKNKSNVYLDYYQLKKDIHLSPAGELPGLSGRIASGRHGLGGGGAWLDTEHGYLKVHSSLAQRLMTCK
jgi:GUN4-like